MIVYWQYIEYPYIALFPHLTYCIDVWGSAYCSNIIKVKKAAHPKPIFKLLNISTFRQLYVYSKQIYICINKRSYILCDWFKKNSNLEHFYYVQLMSCGNVYVMKKI